LRHEGPLVRPGPIHAKRAQKANWSDPAMRAKLAGAYAMAGDDDEKAARILGVSLGSARLAKKRHLAGSTAGRRRTQLEGQGRPPRLGAPRLAGRRFYEAKKGDRRSRSTGGVRNLEQPDRIAQNCPP